jgi:hypothetical protein
MVSEEKGYWSVRGFVTGEETDDEPSFRYSARLRIFGEKLDFDDITAHLGVSPTNTHRRGERKGERSRGFPHDMWGYTPSVDRERPLHEHIDALWKDIKHAKDYLLSLKKIATVDVFLTYSSNVATAGVEVPYTSLDMFKELEIPFGLSIVVA